MPRLSLLLISNALKTSQKLSKQIGLERHPVSDDEASRAALPALMTLIDATPDSAPLLGQLVHIFLSWLVKMGTGRADIPEAACAYVAARSSASNLFNFFVDILIYKPPQRSSSLQQQAPQPDGPPSSGPSSTEVAPAAPASTPFGMSERGATRLLSRHSEYFKSEKKLASLKLQLLSLVSPTRGSLYRLPCSAPGHSPGASTSMAITLLVVASSDSNSEVSSPATDMIKSHLDRARSSLSDAEPVGDPVKTAHLLLSLVLGANPADPRNSRRAASPRASAVMVDFVTKHILQSCPKLFSSPSSSSNVAFTLISTCAKRGTSSSDSKYQVAAAALLNAFSSKLDSIPPSNLLTVIIQQTIKLATAVLASASTPFTDGRTLPHPVAVRDSCYGILSTFSRSTLHLEGSAIEKELISGGCSTAALLFGCSANEESVLRPRANAALDALLNAYQRYSAKSTTRNVLDSLMPLLWSAAVSNQKGARLSAAR